MKHIISRLMTGLAVVALSVTMAFAPASRAFALSCNIPTMPTYTPVTTNYTDTSDVSVGTKFRVRGAPYVTGVKFYKAASSSDNIMVHFGTLGGSSLAAEEYVRASEEAPSGWKTVMFDSPVAVQPGTDYVAWVNLPGGYYPVDSSTDPNSFYTRGYGDDISIAYIDSGSSGYYKYTSNDATVPDSSTTNNYAVTPVVGDDTAPTDVDDFSVTDDAGGPVIEWSEATDSNGTYSADPTHYEIFRTQNSTTEQAGVRLGGPSTFSFTDSQAKPGTAYTYTVKSVDGCLNRPTGESDGLTTASATWENLFSSAPSSNDSATEKQMLGMHWQTSASGGTVAGVRFWRDAGINPSDPLKVLLWDNDGTLLASQEVSPNQYGFYGQNGWGWRDVRFSSPVSVSANHDYVIGYYSSNGRTSYTNDIFASAVTNSNHLTGRQDTSMTYNGVYAQGSGVTSTTFPTSRAPSSTWYGLDVMYVAP